MSEVWVSLLGCDSMLYGENIERYISGGADSIHIDAMDGVYVRNLAFSPKIVADIKRRFDVRVDVHLELREPENYVDMFLDAGADAIAFQAGVTMNNVRLLERIRAAGAKAGFSLSPCDGLEPYAYLEACMDYLILLSVEPGFGNQTFQPMIFDKALAVKEHLKKSGHRIPVGIDGAVTPGDAEKLRAAGVDFVIAGTAVTNAEDIPLAVKRFKEQKPFSIKK